MNVTQPVVEQTSLYAHHFGITSNPMAARNFLDVWYNTGRSDLENTMREGNLPKRCILFGQDRGTIYHSLVRRDFCPRCLPKQKI